MPEGGVVGSALIMGEEILISCTCITTILLHCVFNLPHLSGVPTSPDQITISKGIFSADYMDAHPCISPDFPLPLLFDHLDTSKLSGCCFELQGVRNLLHL